MKNKTYDRLKWLLFVFQPALITLISGLGVALNWDTSLITTIISLLFAFVGSITGLSSVKYNNKGDR